MIKEFSVRPKPQNNIAKIVFFVTLMISGAGVATYLVIDKYRGVVGFLAMLVLVSAILIYTKYIAPAFYYDIMLGEGDVALFVVRQVVGKRQTTLCRIAISDIVSVTRETSVERRRHKTQKGVRRYNYAPTMFAPEVYRITTRGKYENAEILIECSEEFANLLIEYSKEAKERETEE